MNLVGVPTDYSDKNNWAHLPENTDNAVDTFFIYPTLYVNPEPDAPTSGSCSCIALHSPKRQARFLRRAAGRRSALLPILPHNRQSPPAWKRRTCVFPPVRY